MEEEAVPKEKERKSSGTKVPRKMKVLPPIGSTRKVDVLEYVRRHRVPTTNEPERMSIAELRSEAYQYDEVLQKEKGEDTRKMYLETRWLWRRRRGRARGLLCLL